MSLTKRGYTINKRVLTDDKLNEVRKRLTVRPRETPYQSKWVDYSFKVYQEDERFIRVPRFYGISEFGEPNRNLLNKHVKRLSQKVQRTLVLREYQKEAVTKSLKALRDYGGCILQVQPAFGKTACAIYMAYELGYKTIVVVPRVKLLNQWKSSIEEFLPGAKVGIIQGKRFESEGYDFAVATIQTVGLKGFTGDDFREYSCAIYDELQFYASEKMSTVLWKTYSQYVIGLSATPKREDGLDHIFNWFLGYSVVKSKRTIVRKYEPTVKVLRPEERFPELRIESTGNLNSAGMINLLTRSIIRKKLVLDEINKILVDPERKLLVLADRVGYIKDLAKETQKLFPDRTVRAYTGSLKKKEREELDEMIEEETVSVLFATYQLLSVGVSIDYLNSLILATPKKAKATEQATGRILRKDHDIVPFIVDIVDNNRIYINQWQTRRRFYTRSKWNIEYDGIIREKRSKKKSRRDLSDDILDMI